MCCLLNQRLFLGEGCQRQNKKIKEYNNEESIEDHF
jgi:hypothetical protein